MLTSMAYLTSEKVITNRADGADVGIGEKPATTCRFLEIFSTYTPNIRPKKAGLTSLGVGFALGSSVLMFFGKWVDHAAICG